MQAQNITIIGMGRIGASVGLALKQRALQVTLIGHDRQRALAQKAKEALGAVDRVEWNLINAVSAADILVLTVPVSELEDTLRAIGDDLQSHTLVLDLSHMKAAALQWAEQYLEQGHYVGAWPVLAASALADAQAGLETADADLFKNSVFCLMPSAKADPKAVETAVNFGRLLGATPYFMDPMEYDSLVQSVETIPGLMAAALFNAIHKTKGWRDILRFAGLPFAQTTSPLKAGEDIALLALPNKTATLRWLDALLEELQTVRRWLQEGEVEMLTATLEELNRERERWLSERAQNNWVEAKSPPAAGPGIAEQILGRWARGDDGTEE
jgi:prephenate dehydrogenase